MDIRFCYPQRFIFWLLLVFFSAAINEARATMPELTEEPKPNTLQACQQWAAKQTSDALEMWGVKEDGTTSKDFAIGRLTSSCIGDSYSDLVGFGSSAGYNDLFCATHLSLKICKDTELTYDESIIEQDAAQAIIRFVVSKNLIKELSDQELRRLFVPELYSAFSRNARDIDSDWLTGTQELQGLRIDAVKSNPVGRGKLKVDVTYHINGVTQPNFNVSYFVLLEGWQLKIYDVIFNGKASIRMQYR